jgi:hypothetical protein
MHAMFDEIADHCLNHGIDQKIVLDHFEKMETPVTPEFVKETWRVIQMNMYGKKSTTELTTKELQKVEMVFGRFWSELTQQAWFFPSGDNQLLHEASMK